MNKLTVLCASMLMLAGFAHAQQLPMPSPLNKTTQTVGLTDLTIEYSRPGAKGRKVFGEVVKYDAIWRTGANKATLFTCSTDITVEGKELKAGTYSIFTIPGKSEWTVIFNTNTTLSGTDGYKQEEDALRIKVKSENVATKYETMTFDFQSITDESCKMQLLWENTCVGLSIKVNTDEQAWSNIEKEIAGLENAYRVYMRSAQYAARTGKNLDKALEWTNKSLEIKKYWFTYSVQADVYAAMKDYKNALKSIDKALEMAPESSKEFLQKAKADFESKK